MPKITMTHESVTRRASSKGGLEEGARLLHAKCRTPRRMLIVARTLLAMREQSNRAPGLQLTTEELQQCRERGAALAAEARAWAGEIRRAG